MDRGLFHRPWLFELGSGFYDWFTANALWRESCAYLTRFFPTPEQHRPLYVLDLGCGPGVSTIELARSRPDARFIGLDLAPAMIRIAQRETAQAGTTPSIAFVLADAAALPFAAGAFDAVTGHSFLYLVHDRAGILQEAFRVLRAGGRYVSMEPRDGKTRRRAILMHWRNVRYLVSAALWRPYSKYHGRLDEESFPAILGRTGFVSPVTTPVLDGLGIIGAGEKPGS